MVPVLRDGGFPSRGRGLGSGQAISSRAVRLRAVATALVGAVMAGCSGALSPVTTGIPVSSNAWWRSGVCYEVFVRSFYDSDGDGIGDLRGLTARLDYINDGNPASTASLGASCIWLMPIDKSA